MPDLRIAKIYFPHGTSTIYNDLLLKLDQEFEGLTYYDVQSLFESLHVAEFAWRPNDGKKAITTPEAGYIRHIAKRAAGAAGLKTIRVVIDGISQTLVAK